VETDTPVTSASGTGSEQTEMMPPPTFATDRTDRRKSSESSDPGQTGGDTAESSTAKPDTSDSSSSEDEDRSERKRKKREAKEKKKKERKKRKREKEREKEKKLVRTKKWSELACLWGNKDLMKRCLGKYQRRKEFVSISSLCSAGQAEKTSSRYSRG